MADLPILFSGAMVRALLAGTKTQTRRVLKPRGFRFFEHPRAGWRYEQSRKVDGNYDVVGGGQLDTEAMRPYLPYAGGDRLYVREHWRTEARLNHLAPSKLPRRALVSYEADHQHEPNGGCRGRFRQGMHTPRWASRLTLVVTDVRVERLQDISEADAIAEGIKPTGHPVDRWTNYQPDRYAGNWASPQSSYMTLWDSINGAGSWDTNPWVAAYTFRPVLGNIDEVSRA